ncbi:MAG: NAD(P)/FAD-dependent oxidoreductase [Bacteroides sp.]|nr:NAD(P)/FAD-dependent oxidoreductase [Roseburia sp.]MCM1346098.1 NAD(P)/FAD-dependent oxidoreductase [Bacteroides sp.]MCM1422008.1 NAD(P)/FAD-dependent oxidoreductase [Bacteroides sp.]
MKIGVIGGGAAGFFFAVNMKEMCPEAEITIFEKANKVLSKVKVSGGGRCNVTNSFENVTDLKYIYPRGERVMKRIFNIFDHEDAYRWFERHGVRLTTQEDNCVFPQSQDSGSIINCFLSHAHRFGIRVLTGCKVTEIKKTDTGKFLLSIDRHTVSPASSLDTQDAQQHTNTTAQEETVDFVVVTTGGCPRREGLQWLERLGHKIATPVPSLFTFNIQLEELRELMGTVVENAIVTVPSTKFKSRGALLITHWGMSGPAILKLSSYAARHLADNYYRSPLLVNWCGISDMETVAAYIRNLVSENPHKQLSSIRPYNIPSRLWNYLIRKSEMEGGKRWGELGKKGINRIVNSLMNDTYQIAGKGTFREEFVTCGGVSMESVHINTLESKHCAGLYFAGEILDIDAVTGGFNFQAAWTTSFVIAKQLSTK